MDNATQTKLGMAVRQAAGLLLIAVGSCLLLGSWQASLIYPPDPVFEVSSRAVLWAVGSMAVVMGSLCLFLRNNFAAAALAAWFAFSLLMYRLALALLGVADAQAYLAVTASDFGVSPRFLEVLLATAFLGAGIWSGGRVLGWFRENPAAAAPGAGRVKTFCPNCGGHLEVDSKALGQQRPCAHCGQLITLRAASESLKTTCYFCQGHVEFPAHALGRKIACPHCRGEITLLAKDAAVGGGEPKIPSPTGDAQSPRLV